MKTEELIEALLKRAEIRRQIPTRKSVQEGKPDRIADLLEEAAEHIEMQQNIILKLIRANYQWEKQFNGERNS